MFSINDQDIAFIVSKWAGISLNKVLEKGAEKLLSMEEKLQERVVDQVDAINSISNTVRRSRAGLQDFSRPINWIFSFFRSNWSWKNGVM